MNEQQSAITQEPILIAAFHQSPAEEKIIRPVNAPQPVYTIFAIITFCLSAFAFYETFSFFYTNLLNLCMSFLFALLLLFLSAYLFFFTFFIATELKRVKKRVAKNPPLYVNDTFSYFYNTHFHFNQSGPLGNYAGNIPYSDILGVTETIYVIQIKTSTGYYTVYKEDVTYGSPGTLATFLKSMMPGNTYTAS